ncbi:MAG: tetratricopeptide repeat protein [bacterium]|nr:tetratricopeptide repeat protein [bacterium]
MAWRSGIVSYVLPVALVAGCQPQQRPAAPVPWTQQARAATDPDAATALTPPNEYRQRLTRAAMRGLKYDTGRAVIDATVSAELAPTPDADRAREEFQRGLALLQENAVNQALKAHTRAVLLAPDVAEFYRGLGQALLTKRKIRQAAAAFRTALDRTPDDVEALFGLADALNRLGRLEEAVATFGEMLDREPNHAAAHRHLAVAQYYAGRLDEAKKHAARADALGTPVPPQLRDLLAGTAAVAPVSTMAPPVIGNQVRVDLTNLGPGNETSMAASDFDPDEVVATWNDYRQGSARLGVGLSSDGGQTWSDFVIRPPAQHQAATEGDPMTAYDHESGTLWVGAISFGSNGGVYVTRKDAGQPSFGPVVMAEVTFGADKGWMAAGPDPNPTRTGLGPTRVYIAYNEGLLVSTDLGDSWTGPTGLGPGLGFLPRVGPNGELYIGYWDYSGSGLAVRLIRSFDGGNTLSSPLLIATRLDTWGVDGSRFPGDFRAAPLMGLAVDPNDGTLYCVYFDTTSIVGGSRNVDVYFTKSTDQGSTWTTPVVINGDSNPPGDQFFSWIEVGRDGRVHVLFYDTRSIPQTDSDPAAFVEAYYSYSDDGGGTWTETVLTNTPFNTDNDGFGGGFIGDYLGMALAQDRTYPLYLTTDTGAGHVYTHAIVNAITGDMDNDGDVDLDDYSEFSVCLTGPGNGIMRGCDPADLDEDLDVDLDDFGEFMVAFGG